MKTKFITALIALTCCRSLLAGEGAAGATDTANYAAFMRAALRSSLKANNTTSSLGFRCAQSLP